MIKEKIQTLFNRFGYQIKRVNSLDPSMEEEFADLHKKLEGLHLQSVERLYALYLAGLYILKNRVEGDIVECGIFKGASIIMLALLLQKHAFSEKRFFLYDTYEGWPKPTLLDQRIQSNPNHAKTSWGMPEVPTLADVQKNVWATQYPKDNFVFVKGDVTKTIPASLPKKIALLRLDTDGYASTRHELIHLYPLLAEGGVLIIDDYGHWAGSKKAVDEYFEENKIAMLLNRIDYTGRMGIKVTQK